jgi:dTDP-4-amino-4,6-dideoxygalactose transaminase
VSEEAGDQILSLAMFPDLQAHQQSRVVEAIAEFAQIHSVI